MGLALADVHTIAARPRRAHTGVERIKGGTRMHVPRRSQLGTLLVAGLLTLAGHPAPAEPADWGVGARLLTIGAITFVPATASPTPSQTKSESQPGVLAGDGKFFAPVPLESGTVTGFALCARDNDAQAVHARLFAKPYTTATAFTDTPVKMAEVATSGSSPTTQCVSTAAITQPALDTSHFFYYVEIEFDSGAFIDVFSVQIAH
jgi:hypothetical protein